MSPSTGLWQTRGYGYVVDARSGLQVYDVTSVSCIPLVDDPLLGELVREEFGQMRLEPSGESGAFVSGTRTAPVTAFRIQELPEPCRDGAAPVAGAAGYRRSPELVFEVLHTTFAEHYAGFELRGVDWAALGTEYRARVTPDLTDESLFDLLAKLLEHLGDGHVNLVDLARERIASSERIPSSLQPLHDEFSALSADTSFDEYLSKAARRMLEIIESSYLEGGAS